MRPAQVFEWCDDSGVRMRYSVDLAKMMIEYRRIKPLPLLTPELAVEALRLNLNAPPLNPEYVAKANLCEPVIIIVKATPDGERHILIDGWHRVTKAVAIGFTGTLQAYVLEEKDAECVRVSTEEMLADISDKELEAMRVR